MCNHSFILVREDEPLNARDRWEFKRVRIWQCRHCGATKTETS